MLYSGFLLAVLVVDSVFAGNIGIETVFAITRCRASCLDTFSHQIRTEDNCRKNLDCLMCWETCEMLNQNFELWGPMCSVPDICFPGCQKACQSLSNENNLNETRVSNLAVKSVYDLSTDRVLLEWMPKEQADMSGIVLYSVLLKDKNQEWEQIAQTTSHVVHIKGKVINKDSAIGLLAANATHLISYAETTYVNSLIHNYKSPGYTREGSWGPHLMSLERSKNSHSLLATITWSQTPNDLGLTEYEVSWNVMDDAMEVTGHLVTANNISVLTLWPDSIYLVQVKRYTPSGEGYEETSEPLVIDTKFVDNYPIISESTFYKCEAYKLRERTFWILSIILALFGAIICFIGIRHRMLTQQIKIQNQTSHPKEKNTLQHFLKKTLCKASLFQKQAEKTFTTQSSNLKPEIYHVV
ncbi:uncharacterized protein [Parasteatoda tepidariorum]|uniref:uncharacterized protein n=1 Tax=Parasteatoda tepidariorum TaxID=114398 RepID=UPI00077F9C9F|nr:uncharacterized protein LOC107453510 [Parasteatoda tepidariorum]